MKPAKATPVLTGREKRPGDEPDMNDLFLLVPASLIQEAQNAFTSAFGMPIVFVSPECEPITMPDGQGSFCWQLVREGKAKSACAECNRLEHIQSGDLSDAFTCPLSMRDIVLPIKSGDLLFGYLLTAQMAAKPKSSRSRKSAETKDRLTEIGPSMIAIGKLITELAVSARQNQLAAIRDPITGLANRAHFWKRLSEELELADMQNCPVSLLLIDLDNFKQINSTFGHSTGDRVLWLVGQVLRRELRASDLAARYGSDAFVVMLRSTDSTGADMVSWRLKSRIGVCNLTVSGQAIQISASIGSVTYPDSAARDPDDLFKEAYGSLCDARSSAQSEKCKSAA